MPGSSQIYSFQAGNQHILNNARDTRIGNAVFNNVGRDLFNQNLYTGNPLWEAIADVGASHNSEQQVDRGRCLPGTRKAVLKLIRQWGVSNCESMPICWLSGAAGVGKSAIALTVAEECEKDGLVASFFFFRSDPKRNNPSSLILSITHGLVVTRPHLKPFVDQRIAADPRILKARLEDQYKELILENLNHPPPSSAHRVPNLVIIDGLDECGDAAMQRRVLSIIFATYQQPYHYPIRFLICSRPESWIRQEFSCFSDLTKHIELDDSFCPHYDIELYLNQQFQEIQEDPSYSQVVFPNPWPSPHHVRFLVRKADGQFIFVITAMKFVKMEYTLPTDQLCIILNTISNPSSVSLIHSPFNDLDQLYLVVLRANPDCDKRLLPVLAVITITPKSSPAFIELLLGLSSGTVAQTLRAMHSVLNVRGWEDDIGIYHQSFTDFLFSQARSREFYIDQSMWKDSLACRWTRLLTKRCRDDPGLLGTARSAYSSSLRKLVQRWSGRLYQVGRISSVLMSEVDAFYHVALSISAELVGHDMLLRTLAAILLPSRGSNSPAFIRFLVGLRREDLNQTLQAMDTIIHVDQQFGFQSISLVVSTHYTFRDFVFSRSRSKEFFIEKRYHSNLLALKCLRFLRRDVVPWSEDRVLVMENWARICTDVDNPTSEELLFELYHMDLGGAFAKSPNCLHRLLCDFKMISTWLESKTNTADLLDQFKSIQRGFHIRSTTFPNDVIAPIILSIVDWWQSSNPEGETIHVERMMDSGMNYAQYQELRRLATIRLRSAEFCRCESSSAFDSNCVSTLIPGITDMYHVNIPAGCAQVFKRLVASLDTHKTQDLTILRRDLTCHLLVKCPRLIAKCLPLPELLPHFRMLLDFAKTLGLGNHDPRKFEMPRKKLLSWLEKFPPDCAYEVETLRKDLLSLMPMQLDE